LRKSSEFPGRSRRSKKLIKFIPEEDRERVQGIYSARRTRADALPKGQEYWFIDKQGNRKDISLTMALIPEAKKVAVSLLDLTEPNQLRQNLQNLEEKYRGFVENAMIGIGVIQDGGSNLSTPKASRFSGIHPRNSLPGVLRNSSILTTERCLNFS